MGIFMYNKGSIHKRLIPKRLIQAVLILLSVLATIKIYFLQMGIDEEYAVTMAYRIASGEVLFLELWEPHQTSGFLSAFLIRIFVSVTDSLDYLVLYLRVAGSLIQAAISIFLYHTCKKIVAEDAAFMAALFFYNTLPKWIQSPEFANMMIWFSTLAFLCLLRFYLGKSGNPVWLVLAGISLCGMILAYPSCILAVLVFLPAMWMLDKKGFVKSALWLTGTCILLAVSYIGYYLQQMSLDELLYGMSQMMTDGTHENTVLERVSEYGRELAELLPHVLLVTGITLLVTAIIKKVIPAARAVSGWKIYLFVMIMTAQTEQVICWLMDSLVLHYPLIYFYLLYGAGIAVMLRTPKEQRSSQMKAVFWLGTVAGGGVWLSAFLITNTTISVTGPYLMIGMISSILLLSGIPAAKTELSEGKILMNLARGATVCLLASTLFVKGFMVLSNQGIKDDIFLVKQKALSGPAKGIYCSYMVGYDYNQYADLAEEYIQEGTRVLYAGSHSLFYLLGTPVISTPSTISTPTYDERLLTYWELHPEKYPQLVIIEAGSEYLEDLHEFMDLGEPIIETEGFIIYQTDMSSQ